MDAPTGSARLRATRLAAHGLDRGGSLSSPAEVVERLGAIQAQDLAAAKWAIGARIRGSVEAEVDAAIDRGEIVRTWPFRGTLHFVPPARLRPFLALTAERMHRAEQARRVELGLDDDVTYSTARRVAEQLLAGGPATRDELYRAWEIAGLSTDGQRGYHLIGRLARDAVVCLGPVEGREQQFALVEEWVPSSFAPVDRDELLAALVTAYFRGHGPATERDAAWWAGLTLGDIRTGIAAAGDAVIPFDDRHWVTAEPGEGAPSPADANDADPTVAESRAPRPSGRLALAAFDEYFIGYADRSPVCAPSFAPRVVPGGNGVFRPILVDAGRVVGTWRRRDATARVSLGSGRDRPRSTVVTVEPFDGRAEPNDYARALASWARFRGVPVSGVVTADGTAS
ncbi:winged helix DNA-binding domain-containing protein [Agromyces sp. LHK192]|uniref:winged helix DNA-binding domain-containing protein n=1 Tax=Agromyces sp. LHK192 TaxID=2498704 RepID=UPI0013E374CD|nr:winged helix DNA-binding domain-containing protein [Agromyces sp. LHK192]